MKTKPDFKVGENYLHRWWILPRNRYFNIYLHRFYASDDDRALHDHSYWNCSIILRGSYREHFKNRSTIRKAGDIICRFPKTAHRIEILDGPVTTIFITGPRIREWGFHCPKGWRHWKDFTNPGDSGLIGRGCD